tara:strand:+ start:2865 stop:3116 length:252 start_codon:yes stop_codon:yes gene_type:complete
MNEEMIEAHFHAGLDQCADSITKMSRPHRCPSPGEVAGMLTGIMGYVLLKTNATDAKKIVDWCWKMAEEGSIEMYEQNGGEDV